MRRQRRGRRARATPIHLDLRLKGDAGRILGPGRVELLERIDRLRSIAAAAREMGMSYRHAWLLVEYTNQAFAERLVDTAPGGRRGGGTTLTAAGRRVLSAYRRMLRKVHSATRGEIDTIASMLTTPGRRAASAAARRLARTVPAGSSHPRREPGRSPQA